jgi:hypothetical protein
MEPDARLRFGALGRRAALACGIGALLYGVASIVVASLATSALTFTSWSEFVAGYSTVPTLVILAPPFVVALVFPALIVAVHRSATPERQGIALLALVFAAVYSAVLGMAYWLQLTFVPQSIAEGNTEGLALWVLWHPRSFFWALESFGYFSMGIASFLAALVLRGTPASGLARGALWLLGPLGVVFMLNEAIGTASPGLFSIALVFVWVGVTATAMFALRWSFRSEPLGTAASQGGERMGA